MFGFLKSHHPLRHARSFKHAFTGIFHALVEEPNFRVQVVIVVISVLLGARFRITNAEWGLLILSMGLLLMAEVLNTVVEDTIDFFIKDFDEYYNSSPKQIKLTWKRIEADKLEKAKKT